MEKREKKERKEGREEGRKEERESLRWTRVEALKRRCDDKFETIIWSGEKEGEGRGRKWTAWNKCIVKLRAVRLWGDCIRYQILQSNERANNATPPTRFHPAAATKWSRVLIFLSRRSRRRSVFFFFRREIYNHHGETTIPFHDRAGINLRENSSWIRANSKNPIP